MEYESTPEFDAQFLRLTRKNRALEERLLNSQENRPDPGQSIDRHPKTP